MSVSMIARDDSMTVVAGTRVFNVARTHENWDRIRKLVVQKGNKISDKKFIERLDELYSVEKAVKNYVKGSKVSVVDGGVYFNNEIVDNSLTRRILKMMREGFDIQPMARFLENLMSNPSRTAVQELYLFLEQNELPITPDGCFLAYKKVRKNYTDIHTGKFDNSVGKVVEMDRNRVDDKRNNTCSVGLHFASLAYMPQFGSSITSGNHVMIVKINPRDVVSIPSDYNNAKGRTCRYEVIGEHSSETEEAFKDAVVDEYEDYCEWCGDEIDASGVCYACVAEMEDVVVTSNKPSSTTKVNPRCRNGHFMATRRTYCTVCGSHRV